MMFRIANVHPGLLLIAALGAFMASAVAWAAIAEVETAAPAPGRIVPKGQVKTVAAFEAGKIARIAVEEGGVVEKGDLLVALDTTLIDAELAKLLGELGVKAAESARLEAILGWREGISSRAISEAPQTIAAIHVQLLEDQLAAHRARLAELDGSVAERQAHIRTLQVDAARMEKLRPVLLERQDIREFLYRKKHGSKLALLEQRERVIELEGSLASTRSEIAEAKASLASLEARKTAVATEFLRERRAELAKVQERMIALREDIRQARERRARHMLLAPVDGAVHDLAVHTEDGAVRAGQMLMAIVPRDAGLRVEAFLSNSDVGFVRAGQRASLRIATFDYRRYGVLDGTVVSVSRDAVNAMDAGSGPVGNAALPQIAAGPERQAFRVLIELDRDWFDLDGERMPLSSGMAVEASILIGSQKVIEYVLRPLEGYRQDALREK